MAVWNCEELLCLALAYACECGFMEPSAFLIGVVFLWRFGLVVVCGVVFCEVFNDCG